MDKINSSDGLGSSTSSSSILSILSSNFDENQPYKPEFLKYLESILFLFAFLKILNNYLIIYIIYFSNKNNKINKN